MTAYAGEYMEQGEHSSLLMGVQTCLVGGLGVDCSGKDWLEEENRGETAGIGNIEGAGMETVQGRLPS